MDVVSRSDCDAPEVIDGVHLAQLAAGDRMSVQHFTIDPGAYVDDHSHEHEQAGFLQQGQLTFIIDDTEYTLEAGDSFAIPGDVVHAAENRGDEPAVGVEIFSPPRLNPPWASE
ncbi:MULTISPECIES: cupin domain-containing protein [unclassified Haladaptatus]|uniref:cupin domain-containing protein n=1 Tax=unclassified Haladaptatus TaxID=2622732 RepID=UPI0023E85BAD|nr:MULTISPECIES: cupin domain-containing protein [unclassified Haladaptatus]